MSNIDQTNVSPRSNVFRLVEGAVESQYTWREAYIHAVLETQPDLKLVRIYEAIAAIEQRRLSPIENDAEHRELEKAEEGVQAIPRRGREACSPL